MEILQNFIQHTKNDLNRLDKCLIQMEKDVNLQEAVQNMFRIVHIIHGTGQLYGLKSVEELSDPVRSMLSKAKDDPNSYDVKKIVSGYRKGLESILNLLISTGEEDPGIVDQFRTTIEPEKPMNPASQTKYISNTFSEPIGTQFIDVSGDIYKQFNELSVYLEQVGEPDLATPVSDLKSSIQKLLQSVYQSGFRTSGFFIEPCLVLFSNGYNLSIPIRYVRSIHSFNNKQEAESKIDKLTEKYPWIQLEPLLEIQSRSTEKLSGFTVQLENKCLGLLTYMVPDLETIPIYPKNDSNFYNGYSLIGYKEILNLNIEYFLEKYGKSSVIIESEPTSILPEAPDLLVFSTRKGYLVGISFNEVEKILPISSEDDINKEISDSIKIFRLDEIHGSDTIPTSMNHYYNIITLKNKDTSIGLLAGSVLGFQLPDPQIEQTSVCLMDNLHISGFSQTGIGKVTILTNQPTGIKKS